MIDKTHQDSAPAPGDEDAAPAGKTRRTRVDVARNLDALLQAAKEVFAVSGVDAPVREIAAKAGVGVGTLYRHFPQRADLIAAVVRREMDDCADLAPRLAAEHAPFEALSLWLQRYAVWVGTKRGLAAALHSGDPTYDALPAYFEQRLRPALKTLYASAVEAGEARGDVDPNDLFSGIAGLSMKSPHGNDHSERMVSLLIDGLRYLPGKR